MPTVLTNGSMQAVAKTCGRVKLVSKVAFTIFTLNQTKPHLSTVPAFLTVCTTHAVSVVVSHVDDATEQYTC